MADQTITNPAGAHRTITSFIDGADADGNWLDLPRTVDVYRANATIVEGQALMFIAPTATVTVSVSPMTAAIAVSDAWTFAGVAMEAAAAGDYVRVVSRGWARILHDAADTAAALSVVSLPDTTTGRFAIAAEVVTNVRTVGFVAGIESGTDRSLAFIGGGLPQDVVADS